MIETLLGSAPLGIDSSSEPSLDDAVPPVVPITVEVGFCGGFCEVPPEQRTTARRRSEPPTRRDKVPSFIAQS